GGADSPRESAGLRPLGLPELRLPPHPPPALAVGRYRGLETGTALGPQGGPCLTCAKEPRGPLTCPSLALSPGAVRATDSSRAPGSSTPAARPSARAPPPPGPFGRRGFSAPTGRSAGRTTRTSAAGVQSTWPHARGPTCVPSASPSAPPQPRPPRN